MERTSRLRRKTPAELDFDVIIKKAHCGFEKIGRDAEERMAAIIASIGATKEKEAA